MFRGQPIALLRFVMAAILGGGLGGLAAGYYLLRQNVNLCMKMLLLEASDRCGGWVRSVRTEDYIFEQGPRTIRPKGDNALHTLNLISELGLSDLVCAISPNHPAAKNRMICVNNELYSLPSSLREILTTKKPFTKPLISAVFHDLRAPSKPLPDDSIYNFVERRFGKELADYAISPMICGICAGDAKEISVRFLLQTLFEYEQAYGGVIKGAVKSMLKSKQKDEKEVPLSDIALQARSEKWSVYTLRGGLQILSEKLEDNLNNNGVPIHFNSTVKEIEFIDSSNVKLKGNFGQTKILETHFLYSALPAHILAKLVKKQHPELSHDLSKIPFVDVGVVNLHFENNYIKNSGFGFLVPPIENSNILGVIFDSCTLPDQKGTVLTVMMGGRWFQDKFGTNPTEESLLNAALDSVRNTLHIASDPKAHRARILRQCIPQYVIGHHSRIHKIRKYIKDNGLPICLIGSSYDGVSVNDVIVSAKNQVENHNYSWNDWF